MARKLPKRMSEEDKKWWTKIYQFMEKEILGYDDNQHIQRAAVLRIKGLENGKIIANNNTPDNGSYPLEVVYGALLVSKQKFLDANKNKLFETELNIVAYYCAIARGQLNQVYKAWKQKKHREQVASAIQAEEKHTGATYKPKPRKEVAKVSGGFW